MEGKAVGRLAMVSMHLMPPQRSGVQQVPAYSSSSSSSLKVNKRESKYEKVHGDVSSESVSWRLCTPCDNGPPFTDIIYEKANGEGIAKVNVEIRRLILGELFYTKETNFINEASMISIELFSIKEGFTVFLKHDKTHGIVFH
ncbi:hypothetical protein SUGI_1028120 [Cryptomeria japonica]|nr:hypothetical protein SUGI_1028120 [Cryptomeria japonica]